MPSFYQDRLGTNIGKALYLVILNCTIKKRDDALFFGRPGDRGEA